MIANHINIKLTGRHYEAFKAFARKIHSTTSRETLRRLIERTTEYHVCKAQGNRHEALVEKAKENLLTTKERRERRERK